MGFDIFRPDDRTFLVVYKKKMGNRSRFLALKKRHENQVIGLNNEQN